MDKIRKYCIGFLLALILCLPGCSEKEEQTPYQLYYVNYDKKILESSEFETETGDTASMVGGMVQRISGDERQAAFLPEDVQILNYETVGDILRLNFNAAYRQMEPVEEILCRAAIVKNFVQFEGISYVQFTIEGEDLVDSKGNIVGMMGSNSFLENSGKDITAYQYTELELYFANKSGDKLVKEKRSVYYTSNSPIEKVVVEQLIRGPKEEGHYATLPANTGILSVTQVDVIAYVNLDQRFVSEALTIQQELPVYSIVNSLIATGNVQKVQIAVNGETKTTFREGMELEKLYEANPDIVEEDEEAIDENADAAAQTDGTDADGTAEGTADGEAGGGE